MAEGIQANDYLIERASVGLLNEVFPLPFEEVAAWEIHTRRHSEPARASIVQSPD